MPACSRDASTRIAEHGGLRSRYVRKLIQRPQENCAVRGDSGIPKTLIQYWHTSIVPADVRECMETWEPLREQGFARQFFDDDTAHAYITAKLGEPYATAFKHCGHPAMRCDYFRLCFIWKEGGFYVDADDVYRRGDCAVLCRDHCLKLQPLCYDQTTDTMVDPSAFVKEGSCSRHWTFYVNNTPIISPRRHPVIRAALERSTDLLMRDVTARSHIQSTTGPGNLTACLVRHAISRHGQRLLPDFVLLRDWNVTSTCRWRLSYRADERNWRLWRP